MRILKLIRWKLLSWSNIKFSQQIYKEMCNCQRGEFTLTSWELKGEENKKGRGGGEAVIWGKCLFEIMAWGIETNLEEWLRAHFFKEIWYTENLTQKLIKVVED